jgi:hypothetical protein
VGAGEELRYKFQSSNYKSNQNFKTFVIWILSFELYNTMKQQILSRIILDIIILICVLHAWWFVVLPLAIFGVWKYPYFIEIIITGIIHDSLFGFVSEMGVSGYIGTIVSILVFGVVFLLRKLVRK